ncbi:NAD(P)-binding protein [Meredithblackwellia eburnea MCA 4105]
MVFKIDLKGKLCFLTGGGRGIGVDIAKGLAEAGAHLAITYNATPANVLANELAQTYGVRVRAYKMPAEDSRKIDETVQLVTKEMGEIDIVIANAGVCYHVDADKTTDKQFEDTFRINTFSPFYLSRAVYKTWFPSDSPPAVKKDKVILFVSSISGIIYNTPQTQVAYNASKAGLTMLAKSLAGEWAPKGIRVNALSPGYVRTDMSTGSAGGQAWMAEWERRTPIGRFADPKEIADLLVVMASTKASFMTGSDVVVDGGYTIF